VFDADTGAFKRQWGGHGAPFARVTCVTLSKDGRVYVCDRKNNRVQVFKKDGTFVSETIVSTSTAGLGAVWDIALSADASQRYLFVADGQDQRVFVVDRVTLQPVTSFGGGGRWPGAFYAIASLAFDSKGNLYTGEMYEGKRLQKFIRQ
jgi:DNA-binding beta-propeller fold protein YncE